MTMLTTITTKGQVTIPEAVRRTLGASVGDKVIFTDVAVDKKQAVIRIIPTTVVEKLAGSLKSSVGYVPQEKARKIAARALGKRYA
ncbi:AbrB/MazE/SpoVT family DNA-binding domain-containing protein [Candidatus Gottesmanbacteria bacterium]|nr:AbrB/MazE/SpoVT family DNA-binding domain-containing protein [Candidatus Gottesmanbacteria bacterium]